MSEYQLAIEIIKRSDSPTWDLAKIEWQLIDVEESEDEQTCLCGHYPIKELCILRNKNNSRTVTVGNCCVKKFLGLRSDKVFHALKRVRKDSTRSFNEELLDLAFEQGWTSDWENNFYRDVMRKRVLTSRQEAVKLRINEKILRRVKTHAS